MLQKIESHILISVKENGSLVDLSKSKSILFGIKQQYGKYMEFPGELVDGKILVNVASGGGEDDLITFDIEVDFSNCPDAEVTVWESLDKDHNLTSNNYAVELKVQRGAVIAVTSSNLIAGATTEENASFDIAGVEGEYEHTYDSAEYASLSTWTYLVAVNTGGNDNFAYLVLSMRKG